MNECVDYSPARFDGSRAEQLRAGLMMPGLIGSYGFHNASEILYAGKTVCYAAFGQPMLLLANAYGIDMIFASTQQAIALAEIQEKVTHLRLPGLKALRIGGSTSADRRG